MQEGIESSTSERNRRLQSDLTAERLRFTPPQLPEDRLARFLEERWGITGEFKPLSGERDQNLRVCADDGTQYVFKIASPLEDMLLVDFQVQALLHLRRADPGIPVPHIVPSLMGKAVETMATDTVDHVIRLLSWIDGAPMGDFDPPSLNTIEQVGALQGRVCRAFGEFEHSAGSHFMPWNILNGLVVSDELRTEYLRDGLAERCAPALQRLETESLPKMQQLPTQIIHNDAHSGNVMCDPTSPDSVTGVIDFGDLTQGPLLVDLATSMTSVLERSDTPPEAAAALVRGFETHMPLPDDQRELLYDATLARAIMTVQLMEFRVQRTEVDSEFRDIDLPFVKQGLDKLLHIDSDDFLQAVRS
jgi:hydroxylysine kinase